MKHLITSFGALGCLALCLLAGMVTAQETAPTVNREGRVLLPQQNGADGLSVSAPNAPLTTVDRQPLPPEVSQRIQQFQNTARQYLEKQEALKKQLKGTTDEERARIREQLRVLRQQMLEHSRQIRQEFQSRKEELRERLGNYREMLGDNLQDAKNQLQEKKNDLRDRRGID